MRVFSSLTLDLVEDNDESFQLETDNKALLEVFVSMFMHNINQIIDGGKLARTRRAVLMKSKVILPSFFLLNFNKYLAFYNIF